jgi:hypothetical protein
MTIKPPTLVLPDGRTTCCQAYTTIFIDDHSEYCKKCKEDVQGIADFNPAKETK